MNNAYERRRKVLVQVTSRTELRTGAGVKLLREHVELEWRDPDGRPRGRRGGTAAKRPYTVHARRDGAGKGGRA